MPPIVSKQGLYLNPSELLRLYGLPHVAQLLYFAIRRQMNYDDGLVGNRYPISWLELSQALWVEPHQGRQNVGRPEKAALRKSAQLLIAEGLITMKSDVLAKRLIFKCELAQTGELDAERGQSPCDEQINLIEPSAEVGELMVNEGQQTTRCEALGSETQSSPSKRALKSPSDMDRQTAERLFAIKQKENSRARKPNLQDWATGVMLLKKKVRLPNFQGEGSHPITDDEIEQAFVYAFLVNRFWTEQGIITSPKTLLDHLTRIRKPTFQQAFINWLDKGAPINETHHANHRAAASRKSDPVLEGFKELGIHINA